MLGIFPKINTFPCYVILSNEEKSKTSHKEMKERVHNFGSSREPVGRSSPATSQGLKAAHTILNKKRGFVVIVVVLLLFLLFLLLLLLLCLLLWYNLHLRSRQSYRLSSELAATLLQLQQRSTRPQPTRPTTQSSWSCPNRLDKFD